jgi:hypothetical protein
LPVTLRSRGRAAREDSSAAPVFTRDEKFTSGFVLGSHGDPIGVPLEFANMPAQQRELSKNYIGILSDRLEEQDEAMSPAKPDRRIKDYLLDLVAAALNRGRDIRLSSAIDLTSPPLPRSFTELQKTRPESRPDP